MIKRLFSALVIGAMAASSALAGGYLTNTNQSISFLRNPSQDAAIGISSLYNNPAGVGLLGNGFHLSLGLQNVHQNRDVTATFFPLSTGVRNDGPTKKYHGSADAPVLPSLQAAYNFKDKWSVSFDFGIVGGGGKCEYKNGLPSFESSVSSLPVVATALGIDGITGYDFDTYMKGRSYQYGFQFGASYKPIKNLSIYAGLRLLYATNNYYGYVKNIQVQYKGLLMTPKALMAGVAQIKGKEIMDALANHLITPEQAQAMQAELTAKGQMVEAATGDIELNCDQTGWGVTPIIGIDWKINKHWNIAAKYEFQTRMRLKNKSANINTEGHGLDTYQDGKTVTEDVPAILTVGAMYSPIDKVRINAGFHYYWDKQATKEGYRNRLLNGGTWEVTAGVEYDPIKQLTVSAGWQMTRYPNTDAYMNDISFVTNSHSFGLGVKWQINKHWGIEAAYFQTIYQDYNRTQADFNGVAASGLKMMGYNLPEGISAPAVLAAQGIIPDASLVEGKETFSRSNRVIGLGVTLAF